MADKAERYEDNISGAFYCDKTCILCSLCHSIAPENFVESEDGTHDYVYKQPTTDEEEEACQDAMDQCPVNAIGDDGDENE